LTNATTGGTWSSSNTAVATVLSNSGLVNGIGAGGTATVAYTLATSCATTTIVTVNPLPAAISGTASVCVGLTTTLTNGITGGTWSSSNTAASTVITGSGIVSGIAPGTSTLTYTLPTGCSATKVVTTNPLPSGITGAMTVCAGQATLLTNTTTGGTWASSNTLIATVGLSSGSVNGVAPGTAAITYTVGAGCSVIAIVTVNPLSPITGPTSVCTGSTATLSDATSGGTWSSTTTSVATILSGTGSYSSVGIGTSVISYTLSTGCIATTTVTVVSTATPITGPTGVCIGSSAALTETGLGTWTSNNTSIATVSSLGNVFGVATGTATITFSLGTSCNASYPITVNPLPGAITGVTHACIGSVTILTDGTGTWNSSNTSVATVDPANGHVSGVTNGTTSITFTLGTGCTTSIPVTINPLPGAISGNPSVCIGATTALTDGGAGTWSSSNTSRATVSSSGIVSGVAAGTSTIIYTLSATGCGTSLVVTINSLPPSISGPSGVCIGGTASLADGSTGGVWSSSVTSTATVDAGTGLVSGLLTGTSTITYSLGAGCAVTRIITVNPLPSGISGPTSVCLGSSILLTNGTTGGTWSSSTTGVATVLPGSGSVTTVSPGADTISYRITGTGCARALIINVNPVPAGITGSTAICLGSGTSLSDASTGGTWSSSNTLVISVGVTSGTVTSLSPGTATITYKLPTGCLTTSVATVNTLPSLITGTATACEGATTLLSDVTTGGTWSSSNTGIATVLPGSGIVTAVTTGVDTIRYTGASGCSRIASITVNAAPAAITGLASLCAGSTASLTDANTGGTWSSSSSAIASVGITSGTITGGGVSGTTVITYRVAGCVTTGVVTVNLSPSPITGVTSVCAGATSVLSDITSAGTWSSSNTGIATIDASGTVSGIVPGTTTITYMLGSGCSRSVIVAVNNIPPAIIGSVTVCAGSTTVLDDATTGGTWSSSNTSVATTSGGTISGATAGTAIIIYTAGGCSTSTSITVNPLPSAITGVATVCTGATTTLAELTTGGTWSSSATSIATVEPGSGIVHGLVASTAIITYTGGSGCFVASIITVNPLPVAITGTASVCTGATVTLVDGSGGTWTSSNTAVATTPASAGNISGVITGTTSITYTSLLGCATSIIVTVNATPPAITGTTTACQGATTTLADGGGGTWTSSSTSVATVSATGAVGGVATGTTSITYTLAGCSTHITVTVSSAPGAITGTMSACLGASVSLIDPSGIGTWSSGTTTVATVDGSGHVTTVSAGITTIAFTNSSGCHVNAIVTVNPAPVAIGGATTVCVGGTITLTDASAGGTWSSSDNTAATVSATTGVVTGVSETTATITYTLPTGCATTATVTDNCNVGVKQVSKMLNKLSIAPNPNKGLFTITGTLTGTNDQAVTIEVVDMIGKVVYKANFTAKNGTINEQINLNSNLANGMYLLNLHSETETGVLHFVMEK